jgi:hypothetical protein
MNFDKFSLMQAAGLEPSIDILKEEVRVKNFNNVTEDQVGVFYVVTNKLGTSDTLADIMFESDVFHFANQVRGGLAMEDVYGLYTDKNKATQVANMILKG